MNLGLSGNEYGDEFAMSAMGTGPARGSFPSLRVTQKLSLPASSQNLTTTLQREQGQDDECHCIQGFREVKPQTRKGCSEDWNPDRLTPGLDFPRFPLPLQPCLWF